MTEASATGSGVGPPLGAHTRTVLAEVGYSAEEIDELVRPGVAA
jgi:crotonobetainyl-CoA:carnitine CoA-transferase CaiB-like acyl-CoA transferase